MTFLRSYMKRSEFEMKIWINKNKINEEKTFGFENAYEFSIKRDEYSTMYTHIDYIWRQFGANKLEAKYEDLFIIAMSVFSIDKRISRTLFNDNWTRELEVSIPVLEVEKWEKLKEKVNQTLGFLTGDIWKVEFRKTKEIYLNSQGWLRKENRIDKNQFTAVSLFSGGLDSFCGAIHLAEQGESLCLVGHNEYPKLRAKQEKLSKLIDKKYPSQNCKFISFSANSYAPELNNERLSKNENTSRGRSFLFICIAVTIAGIIGDDIPVYIPENGFIGLNIPLTNSRKGSCSTRTTHPYFIKNINEILDSVEIKNKVCNIFAYETKRAIVNSVKENEIFKKGAKDTISCSHPCIPRYNKNGNNKYPINCGYCYPCLIRKSSLIDVKDLDGDYVEKEITIDFMQKNENRDITNDARAVLSSIFRYNNIDDKELIRLIRCSGELENDQVEKFKRVYKSTMNDLMALFSDAKMKEYMGLN